jgi:hypothetical protein
LELAVPPADRRPAAETTLKSSRTGQICIEDGFSRKIIMKMPTKHTFPGSRRATDIWSDSQEFGGATIDLSANKAFGREGFYRCGTTQMAALTVGAPFVVAIAASLVIRDLL